MSRSTAQDQSHQDSDQATSHSPDLDAEHRPDVARRASVANLQKQAAKSGSGANPTTEDRKAQREKSNQTVIKGAEASIKFASQQMFMHARELEAFAGAPKNEAGTSPLQQAVSSAVMKVESYTKDLSISLANFHAAGIELSVLQQAIAVMQAAHERFDRVVKRVSGLIEPSDKDVAKSLQDLHATVNSVCKEVGVGVGPSADNIKAVENTREDKALVSAFESSLTAAIDAVRLARMSVRGVADDVRIHDFKRASGTLRELASLASQLSPPAFRAHRTKLLEISRSAGAMFAEQHAHQAFDVNQRPALTTVLDAAQGIRLRASHLAEPAAAPHA